MNDLFLFDLERSIQRSITDFVLATIGSGKDLCSLWILLPHSVLLGYVHCIAFYPFIYYIKVEVTIMETTSRTSKTSTTSMTVRLDSSVKKQAQKIYSELGIDMTTAINVFLRQSIRSKGFPFDVNLYLIPYNYRR